MNQLIKISVGLLVLGGVFWFFETISPSKPAQQKLRKDITIDLPYWFLTPIITKTASRVAVIILLLPLIFVFGVEVVQKAVLNGHGFVAQWPIWFQGIVAIVMGDFIGYWIHRAFHVERLWTFHAVHHTSTELDWLSAARVHPVNEILSRLIQAIPFLLLGFPAKTLALYIPIATFYAIMLHANVSWTFGPLKHIFASPVFHRWHHSDEPQAQDKNFSGLFPVWDLLFGTFYLPEGKQPQSFGISDNKMPAGFFGQLIHPFLAKRQG
jgi:sterol desaturase/sphingolipid hydroxylase (fatty acid hydroxylase superfamily)